MIDSRQAQQMLDEVARTEQRSEQYLGYWRGGVYVQLWGVVWIAAHLATFFLPSYSGWIWGIGDGAGMTATVLLRLRDRGNAAADNRLAWAAIILIAFGLMASFLIGSHGRALEVFWTCMVMTGYMLRGLWFGARWIVLGGLVCAASLLAYCYLRPWFDLAMALAAGGGLLLGGTWLRGAR